MDNFHIHLPSRRFNSRNQQRSERYREFVGSVSMCIESLRRWSWMQLEELAWILEFDGHPNFMKVVRDLYSESFGSIYQNHATESEIKFVLKKVGFMKFKNLLFNYAVHPESASFIDDKIVEEPIAATAPPSIKYEDSTNVWLPDEKLSLTAYIDNWMSEHQGEVIVTKPQGIDDQLLQHENEMQPMGNSVDDLDVEIISKLGHGREFLSLNLFKPLILSREFRLAGELMYKHLDNSRCSKFPLIIYAPPGSGKSEVNKALFNNRARYLKEIFLWGCRLYFPVVFVDSSHYVYRAKYSVMVIPTERIYYRRISSRARFGLADYNTVLRHARRATISLKTNAPVYDAIKRSPETMELLRALEIAP